MSLSQDEQNLILACNLVDPQLTPAPAPSPKPAPAPAPAPTPSPDIMPVPAHGPRLEASPMSPLELVADTAPSGSSQDVPSVRPVQPTEPVQPVQPIQPISGPGGDLPISLGGVVDSSLLAPERRGQATVPSAGVILMRVATEFLFGPARSISLITYDLERHEQVFQSSAHLGNLKSISASATTHRLLVMGDQGTAIVYGLVPPELTRLASWQVAARNAASTAILPDGDHFVMAGTTLDFWRLAGTDTAEALYSPEDGGEWSVFRADRLGLFAAIASWRDRLNLGLRIRSLDSGRVVGYVDHQSIHNFQWSGDSKRLAFMDRVGFFHTVDLSISEDRLLVPKPLKLTGEIPNMTLGELALSPDSQWMALGGNRAPAIFRRESDSQFRYQQSLGEDEGTVYSLAFSNGGRMLATATDGLVRLWDTRYWRILAEFSALTDSVSSLMFSPDDQLLAGGDKAGLVVLWDVQSKQELIHRQVEGIVSGLAFSADSRSVAIGTTQGTLHLGDISNRAWTRWVAHGTGGVASVTFGRTPGSLISCGFNGEIRSWHVDLIRAQLQDLGIR